MIRMFLIFLITCFLVSGGIATFRAMTGLEKWQFTKILAYGIMVSAISVAILTTIVIVF